MIAGPPIQLLGRGVFSRRSLIAAAAAASAWPATARTNALAAPDRLDLAAVLAAEAVYFEETGHTVAGPFWRLWRSYGLDGFGYPITEPFEDGGVVNQYFQRARMELADPAGALASLGSGGVRLGLLGLESGGAEPAPAAQPGESGDSPAATPGTRLIPETGHAVSGAFLPAYDHWKALLGPPIAPEHPTAVGYVQYFATARLEWDARLGVRLGLLGDELAAERVVETAPVDQPAGAITWTQVASVLIADEAERATLGATVSGGQGFVPEFGEKWIAVSIAKQRVTAYEHAKPVFTDLCSTGVAAKGLTNRGVFAIWRRVANETMDSTTIGIPKGDPKYYKLENVLYTQYFDFTGEALHYAWWHNNFGTPMSYGCVNLRLATAKWFWDWATLGTRVVVA